MAYINEPTEITEGENFLIFTPKSVHIPGDERSRTNPGHGYPAHTEESWNIQRFDSREEWEAEITKMTERDTEFVPFAGTRPSITTTTTINID